MSLVIQSNMAMMNAQNNFKINTDNKAKSAERLASGLKINRAADDAAGLAISEKMRYLIRGLDKGTYNAQSGISWVQIGDGALGEVQDILHRMKELTIQSLNDTNTDLDRAALQSEFDMLQSEIDNIADHTHYNTLNIFNEHQPTYYQYEGNVKWDQGHTHVISDGANDLNFTYKTDDASAPKTVSVSVPRGNYTTQELTDELEDALRNAGVDDVNFEYTDKGTFNLNLENGERIENVSGGLSYLIYDVYEGGSVGSLVGTTSFRYEDSALEISSENNTLSFTMEDFNGTKTYKTIVIPNGSYTREALINLMNNELSGSGVTAEAYGAGIKLASNDYIITEFKGNMFKIDDNSSGRVYSSVFYDNVKYGNISMQAASFVGAGIIPTDARDAEHQKITIGSNNNSLTFNSNGTGTEITIIIPEEKYTIDELKDKLNALFVDSGLELNAKIHTDGGFKGITIDSTVKGAVSEVGLDSTSSAYETLFSKRVYNNYVEGSSYDRETRNDEDATFTGSKKHTSPLVITAGVNDSFTLNLGNGNTYDITLTAKTYDDVDALRAEINDKLNGSSALSGYKDKITVSVEDNKIKLTSVTGSGIMNVSAQQNGTNTGYNDIFVGTNVTYTKTTQSNTGTATSKPVIELNTPIADGTTINDSNKNLNIYVDGVKHTVTLPTGNNITHDQIEAAIENQIKERTETTPNTFTTLDATGQTIRHEFNSINSVQGNTVTSHDTHQSRGETIFEQGTADDYKLNNPATVKLNKALPDSMVINNSNNTILLTTKDSNKTEIQISIKLDSGTYSKSALRDAIQRKIDNELGTSVYGVKVDFDSSGKLTFTSRINRPSGGEIAAENTYIKLDSYTSSFIKELYTTRTPASCETAAMQSTINIAAPNNTFEFDFTENNVTRRVTLTLEDGPYSRSSIIDQINKQLRNQNIGVTATPNGNGIKLTTIAKGIGNKVSYYTTGGAGGSAVESIFGPRYTYKPATKTADRDILENIEITDQTKDFTFSVNGQSYTVELDQKIYTSRLEFINMLNSKIAAKGLKAEPDGNKIKYTTDAVGDTAKFYISYAGGGSSMKAIYGETTRTFAGVDAEFTPDGKLKLTGSQNGGKLEMSSDDGGMFQTSTRNETPIGTSSKSGFASNKISYMDGVNITEPLTIDEWNDELKFTYNDNGTGRAVSITLAHQDYTFAELQNALQTEVDSQLGGSNIVKATVTASGVRLETVKPGSRYYLQQNSFSGDFYNKVMCKAVETTQYKTPKIMNGVAPSDTAYVVGRKDVKNKPVEIKTGVNDVLSIQLKYQATEHTLVMTLDAGIYSGDALKDMIQEKLNEKLVANGLSENLIEVGIGGINTGVTGANDANALNFKLSRQVRLPAEGQYIIDGVGGTAAFSVFYQTDGELIEAYVKGAKDISEGAVIEAGANELSFDVDGTSYTITIPEGEYTGDELIAEIKNQVSASAAPVSVEMEDGNLKIFHKKLGVHKITNISGSAKQNLFFQENGVKADAKGIKIQISNKNDDYVEIDHPIMNTAKLGINSIVISQPKYANKALERIDTALNEVSDIRSHFGAIQNRLEIAVNGNQNTSENTQSAESVLRDADMAAEMVEFSRHNILAQAAQSVMAQANDTAEGVLRILGK